MDLLRILALGNGRPVSISSIIDKLWPGVSEDKARASIRTASSQIRKTIGTNCVARQNGSLVLLGAWVDAIQFREAAGLARGAARLAQYSRTIELTQPAERLYQGDFHAHNDTSAWALAERNELRQTRRVMLCDAADAAIALGDHHVALEFAGSAVRIDPTSEAAHRALMLAYAGLGETASALRVFEECRAHLAEELGADPSAQTQQLHVRLLRGELALND
jgi:SARP family transcriptional regulator, regulator of embCAB operon